MKYIGLHFLQSFYYPGVLGFGAAAGMLLAGSWGWVTALSALAFGIAGLAAVRQIKVRQDELTRSLESCVSQHQRFGGMVAPMWASHIGTSFSICLISLPISATRSSSFPQRNRPQTAYLLMPPKGPDESRPCTANLHHRNPGTPDGYGKHAACDRTDAFLIEQGIVQPAVVEAALAKQKHVRDAKTQENNSIRVDAEKLDQLINQVGELIIAAASANLAARRSRIDELQETTSTLSHLVEEVRDRALQLRMVKIGATFNRFQRVVHSVSRELGKDIALAVDGEDTELDKTVVEKIADPLTHLVRNAMDHGIEPAEIRLARGKPSQGCVRLNAYHDSGCIVIEVSDDGGGLQRDKILAKAVERGLVDPERHFSDHEIDNLIFEPGFSTADQVTNLSGRGVGMDVVKRNITALRGSVDVKSEEGRGMTVTVRLPLTLAIINGFLVGLGKLVFVIPLDMIEECVEFSAEAGHDYTNLRGEVLPFIRLRELFEVAGVAGRRQSIVVIKHAGQKAGLLVDTLLGEFQTVIKPLGKMFSRVDCISGSSILGNGEVALILDVAALFRTIEEKSMRQLAA